VDEGWHPDPECDGVERWWDGAGWTEHTRTATPPLGAGRRVLERDRLNFVLDERTWAIDAAVSSPFWAGAVLVILSVFRAPWLGTAAVLVGVVAVLCLLDRRMLRRRRAPVLPSRRWVLLGAIGYLYARGRALGQSEAPRIGIMGVGLALLSVPLFVFTAVALGLSVPI